MRENMAKREGKNKILRKLLTVFCIAILTVSALTAVYSYLSAPIETRTVDARFSVSNELGIDVDKDALTFFGRLLPGSQGSQNIYIENKKEFPVLIKIFSTNEIAPYLSSEKEIILMPGENKSIGFVLSIPKNMSFGDYSGKVILRIYRYDSSD